MSSNPVGVTLKTQFMRKATGNHLKKSTSLEKNPSPVSGFCCAQNQVYDAVQHPFTTGWIDGDTCSHLTRKSERR